MKYIIEVEKIPGTDLYKAKGFNTLVFDQYGLGHMQEYNADTIDKIIHTAMKTERNRIYQEMNKLFLEE